MNKIMRLPLKSLIPLPGLLLVLYLSSCTNDNAEDFYDNVCDTTNVTYSGTIQPILANNCISCHMAGNSSGVDLETYEDVKAAADNGTLSGAINQLPGYSAMPPFGKLDDCTIAKIDKWINEGTPNN